MKVGDKVRFLSETGGGIVSGFSGKDVVLVEDEDGFEIPMLITQVVVIEDESDKKNKTSYPGMEDRGLGAKKTDIKAEPESGLSTTSLKAALNRVSDEPERDFDPADKEVTFHARPLERRGGNLLNVHLAFVPEGETKETLSGSGKFTAYLVNNSNYYLQVLFMSNENNSYQCRFMGTVEPNTQLPLEHFDRTQLNDMERLCIQLMAYKVDRPFMMKPAMTIPVRLDPVKFYKIHTFQQTEFFSAPALMYDLVIDDNIK